MKSEIKSEEQEQKQAVIGGRPGHLRQREFLFLGENDVSAKKLAEDVRGEFNCNSIDFYQSELDAEEVWTKFVSTASQTHNLRLFGQTEQSGLKESLQDGAALAREAKADAKTDTIPGDTAFQQSEIETVWQLLSVIENKDEVLLERTATSAVSSTLTPLHQESRSMTVQASRSEQIDLLSNLDSSQVLAVAFEGGIGSIGPEGIRLENGTVTGDILNGFFYTAFAPSDATAKTDSVRYTIKTTSETIHATLHLSLNHASDIQDDRVEVGAVGLWSGNLFDNDSDIDGDALQVSGIGTQTQLQGSYGVLSIDHEGNYSYSMQTGGAVQGEEQFSFTVSDGHGFSTTSSLIFDVDVQPPGPETLIDYQSVARRGVFFGNVLHNDPDFSGGDLFVNGISDPDSANVGQRFTTSFGAQLVLFRDGSYQYDTVPVGQRVSGSDQIQVSIGNGAGGFSVETLFLGYNETPTAQADVTQVLRTVSLQPQIVTWAVDVLSNDSDPNHDLLFISNIAAQDGVVYGQTADGRTLYQFSSGSQAYVDDNGDLIYQISSHNPLKQEILTYTVSDAYGATDEGQLLVFIDQPNFPAVVAPDVYYFSVDHGASAFMRTGFVNKESVLHSQTGHVSAEIGVDGNPSGWGDGDAFRLMGYRSIETQESAGYSQAINGLYGVFYAQPDGSFWFQQGKHVDAQGVIRQGALRQSEIDNLSDGEFLTESFEYTISDSFDSSISRGHYNLSSGGLHFVIYNNLQDPSSPFQNSLLGQGGNDTLTGTLLSDVIDGGAGNDWISGGLGADILTGGIGQDVFSFQIASILSDNVVTDFTAGQDSVELRDVFDVRRTFYGIDHHDLAAGVISQEAQYLGQTVTLSNTVDVLQAVDQRVQWDAGQEKLSFGIGGSVHLQGYRGSGGTAISVEDLIAEGTLTLVSNSI